MLICVSICANYLPKAMVLATSVKRHIPDATFVLCLLETCCPEAALRYGDFDEIVLAKDLGWDNFEAFIFRHSIVEASTAIKGRLFLYLLEHFQDENRLVYLDPDVKVYDDFSELRELLNEHSLILAPHLLRPGNIEMEISSLAHGCYNLGFIALRRSANAEAFLAWWAERLFSFCYDEKERGLFTDQRWVDLAPCFFSVHILKHHGYDFATWSLLGCKIQRKGEKYLINGDPLRFIHFSGIDSGTIDVVMSRWMQDNPSHVFFEELYCAYLDELAAHDARGLSKIPWSYGAYSDGSAIAKEARKAYRNEELCACFSRPFQSSNEHILQAALDKGFLQDTAKNGKAAHFWRLVTKIPGYLRQHGLVMTLQTMKRKLVEIFHALG